MINTSNVQYPRLTENEKTNLFAIRDDYNNNLIKIMEQTNKSHADMDLSLIWKETNNLEELYEQLSDLKKCLDSF